MKFASVLILFLSTCANIDGKCGGKGDNVNFGLTLTTQQGKQCHTCETISTMEETVRDKMCRDHKKVKKHCKATCKSLVVVSCCWGTFFVNGNVKIHLDSMKPKVPVSDETKQQFDLSGPISLFQKYKLCYDKTTLTPQGYPLLTNYTRFMANVTCLTKYNETTGKTGICIPGNFTKCVKGGRYALQYIQETRQLDSTNVQYLPVSALTPDPNICNKNALTKTFNLANVPLPGTPEKTDITKTVSLNFFQKVYDLSASFVTTANKYVPGQQPDIKVTFTIPSGRIKIKSHNCKPTPNPV